MDEIKGGVVNAPLSLFAPPKNGQAKPQEWLRQAKEQKVFL